MEAGPERRACSKYPAPPPLCTFQLTTSVKLTAHNYIPHTFDMSDATKDSIPLECGARIQLNDGLSQSALPGLQPPQADTGNSLSQPSTSQKFTTFTSDAARFRFDMDDIQRRHGDACIYSDTEAMDAEFAKLSKLTTIACAQAEKHSKLGDVSTAEQKIKELENESAQK
ncbi:hypothetical protein NX059_007350 [Plenodomus lindquistii]|nr:hypothetical protein NX059_007350 [Plenodomus lindquistii]